MSDMGATGSSPILDLRDIGFLILLFWCWVLTIFIVTAVSASRLSRSSKKPGHTPPTGAAWVLRDLLSLSLLVVWIIGVGYAVIEQMGNTLVPAILVLLVLLAVCCYMVGDILYDRQTITVPSGRRYPRYEILSYLTPEQKAKVKNYEWGINFRSAAGLPRNELRGRRLDRDPNTERLYCPLGAVLSNGEQFHVPESQKVAKILRPIHPSDPHGVTSYRAVLEASQQFVGDNDSGKIDPADVIDIFTAPL